MSTLLVLLAALSSTNSAPIFQQSTSIGGNTQPPLFALGYQIPPCLSFTRSPEIILSLTTIFACTWATIHPDIPRPQDSGWTRFKKQTIVLLYALFAPELTLWWAWKQRRAAIVAMKEYNVEFRNDGECFLPHKVFERNIEEVERKILPFVARYLVVIEEKSWLACISDEVKGWFTDSDPDAPAMWTLTHGFFVNMGGFVLFDQETPLHPLNFNTLKALIQAGEVAAPETSEMDIKDRSKADLLTRLLFLQAAWFILHCIRKPHVTLLDLTTLAYVAVNFTTYLLWWSKPQNVRMAIPVTLKKPFSGVSVRGEKMVKEKGEYR